MPTKKTDLAYSVLDMNMDEVGDPTIAPEGEHILDVVRIQLELSKKERPMAVIIARISLFFKILSIRAFSTLRILPLKGRIA